MAKVIRDEKKLLKESKKNPHNSTPLVELGWFYFENKNYPHARQHFERAIEVRSHAPAVAEATYGLALLDFDGQRYDAVRERLRQLLRDIPEFPQRPDVHFLLARANDLLWHATTWRNEEERRQAEFLHRAQDHYQQAIERRAEQQDAASLYLGKLYHELQQSAEALPYFQRAAQAAALPAKMRAEALYLAGNVYFHVTQDHAQAKQAFEAAIKIGASHDVLAEMQHRLGEIARLQDEDEDATQRYEQALAAYKDQQSAAVLDVLTQLSELRLRHHWYQDAVTYAARARAFPDCPDKTARQLLNVLAQGYAGLKDYPNAITHEDQYFAAVKDAEEKAISLHRQGLNYEHVGQPKDALDAYRKGLKFTKRKLTGSKLNAAIGRLYLAEERQNQAINHLKEALEFAAEDAAHAAHVHLLLAECHVKRGEIEKALDMYGVIIAKHAESNEEPVARQELKNFRKQFKKEIQEMEKAALKAEPDEKTQKAFDPSEKARFVELIDEILDEKGFFERLKEGLAKTHLGFVAKIEQLLANRSSVDEDLIENLEEALILADIGVGTTTQIIEHLQESVARKELNDPAQVKYYLKREITAILNGSEKRLDFARATPFVILVIGVNGTGKTTTIGKLASKIKAQGKEVLLVAGDTFRAAAIEQLEIWGERAGCEVIKHASGADPSAVMFDAIQAAKARKVDVLLADTAGRLHTKKNLMEELKKIVRVISRELPGAPHEILMVIDATTGQNAISQAQLFNEGVGLTGLVLTKLDGTAKGGIIVGIANELKIPVTYIGIGESVEDLREFHAKEFVEALFED